MFLGNSLIAIAIWGVAQLALRPGNQPSLTQGLWHDHEHTHGGEHQHSHQSNQAAVDVHTHLHFHPTS
jgi:NRE family putative nickel resistance protein-like MFS transporter